MRFVASGAQLDLDIKQIVVAGWTGRNREAVDHHIQELAAIGIAPPSEVPLYYRVSNGLLTHAPVIDVLGAGTSGEVEPLLIKQGPRLWLGLASDHTDRELEAHSVAASKQACPKPVAAELWEFDSVSDHVDSLLLRCRIREHNQWVTYQDGTLESICPLSELAGFADFTDGTAMLCGTLAAIDGVRPAADYQMELIDPLSGRSIGLNYSVNALPVVL
jgi:hypothetical protein